MSTKLVAIQSEVEIQESCRLILDIIFREGTIKPNLQGEQNKANRIELEDRFRSIYEAALNRRMERGEDAVFNQAISILLQVMQGVTFREIVGMRYSYVSRRDSRSLGQARFSQPAKSLPNKNLKAVYSLFESGTAASRVSYDAIVFDTYDYLDQVISFSLTDTFVTAFQIYEDLTSDTRAGLIIELLRYGTNDRTHVMLLRYGFAGEDVAEIANYIRHIDENNILFEPTIFNAPEYIKNMISWYLP